MISDKSSHVRDQRKVGFDSERHRFALFRAISAFASIIYTSCPLYPRKAWQFDMRRYPGSRSGLLSAPSHPVKTAKPDSGLLQISLFKESIVLMSVPEDLFSVIARDLYQKRVYRSQLRGSNGFSPFSLLKERDFNQVLVKENRKT